MGIPYAEVIGDPIAHSKSPLIHKFWLKKLGMEGDYRAVRVAEGELAEYLTSRRNDPDWRGCNVTIPHKQIISGLLDEIRDQEIGAVNCVLRDDGQLIGRNTDTAGVDHGFRGEIIGGDAPVCIVGAGGAASAAIASLDVLCVFDYHVVVRDPAKGQILLDRFDMRGGAFGFDEAAGALDGCIGLINASPLGMEGFPPMPEAVLDGLSGLAKGSFVFDMVYSPLRTRLLERADDLGLSRIDGLTMLIGQAAHAFRLFFGKPTPEGSEAELRELLTQ